MIELGMWWLVGTAIGNMITGDDIAAVLNLIAAFALERVVAWHRASRPR